MEKGKKGKCKRFLMISLVSLLCLAAMVSAVSTTLVKEYTSVPLNTYQAIPSGTDIKFTGINSIFSDTINTILVNQTATVTNGSTATLSYSLINSLSVINASNGVELTGDMYGVNYSLNNATGVLLWNLSGAKTEDWNGQSVKIMYTKISNAGTLPSAYYQQHNENAGYGIAGEWKLIVPAGAQVKYTPSNWNVSYTISTSDTATSCNSTKAIIFSAFGLLALVMVVGAGFLLIKMGELDAGMITATIISFIGLAVILFVGFIVISNIALTTC